MEFFLAIIPLLLVLAILVGFGFAAAANEKRQKLNFTFCANGVYDHVEYGMEYYTKRSGAMVHTTSTHSVKMTAVFFEDGRTVVGSGHIDIPYPKGTRVSIYKNPYGRLKIEESRIQAA